MRPLDFLYHLARRLCVWAYEPTSREKMHAMFELGEVAGEQKTLQKLAITQAQTPPRSQNTGPIVELPPALCWPTRQWSRHFFTEMRPDLYKPPHPARIRKTVRLVPLNSSPRTGPISRIDTRPVTAEQTEKYRALPRWVRE